MSVPAETINGSTIDYNYGYDELNRLIQVGNGNPAQLETYAYDPLNNRTGKTLGSVITAYVYDAANQLQEIRADSATGSFLADLNYDANGNLTSRSDTGASYTYDALNRLIQVSQTGLTTQIYGYDGQGRRINKTIGADTQHYLYNGLQLIAEYANAWTATPNQYTHGPRLDEIAIKQTATGAQYYHQDGLNSLVAITNTAGTTDATQKFDAWGNINASTGTAQYFGYTGREKDETGLMYYRARYYAPDIGRFTQQDPIGLRGGLNYYVYVNNNPINAIDPLGTIDYIYTAGNPVPKVENINVTGSNYYIDNGQGTRYPTGGSADLYQHGSGFSILLESQQTSYMIEQMVIDAIGPQGPQIPGSNDINLDVLVFDVGMNSPEGGDYDFKQWLPSEMLYVVNGVAQSHDYIGNFAWGALLAAKGLSEITALTGAQLQGIYAKLKKFKLGLDDPHDQEAIRAGHEWMLGGSYVIY